MEQPSPHNSTAPDKLRFLETSNASQSQTDGTTTTTTTTTTTDNAYLYILIVLSFYGVFLFGIMLVYFRSKRREKRRSNVFMRLVHEEEEREWGLFPKKHSLTFMPVVVPAAALHAVQQVTHSLPHHHHGPYDGHHHPLSPLACALCAEQSSVSSLCSSPDVRFAIEEEESSEPSGSEDTASTPPRDKGSSLENSDDSAGDGTHRHREGEEL